MDDHDPTHSHDPADALDPTVQQRPRSTDLGRIGPYVLREKLGEGGMGEVWLAEQREPIRRRVAVKVIKLGMDTQQVVARFEVERQALAMMDHPAIARIFDAGSTPEGRPYFVMEHVKGVPINEYCDRYKLSNRERLDLFAQVCEGVQHAHQKAVIHRDLKPGNVLVTVVDGRPQPKIIDFGVAKATNQRLTDSTLHTHHGAIVGTPAYMSPEQAEMSGLDVDTRSDVYSLGVMLYELLAGALPFAVVELKAASFEAMVRKIREEEPPRPSTRLSSLGPESKEVAARRRTELSALSRELSGDLDWIAMKALEKDRTRRYGSPQDLAADIRRYLDDEPVVARPPSVPYRLRKFVKRHALGVGVAAAAVLVVVGFAVTMTVQAERLAAQRDVAERARADLETVVAFQADMLSTVDPESFGLRLVGGLVDRVAELHRSADATEADAEAAVKELRAILQGVSTTDLARDLLDEEILDRAVRTLDAKFADQPLIDARLRLTIGETYAELSLLETAESLIERALEIFRSELGDLDRSSLEALKSSGVIHARKRDYAKAVDLYSEATEGYAQAYGREDGDYLETLGALAGLMYRALRYDEADSLHRFVLAEETRLHGPDHERTISALIGLGRSCMRLEMYAEADSLLELAVDASVRVLGENDEWTREAINLHGLNFYQQDLLDEAEVHMRRVMELSARDLGPDHEDSIGFKNNLAALHAGREHWDEASRLYEECIDSYRRAFGDLDFYTLNARESLAEVNLRRGRLDESRRQYLEVLDGRLELQGPENRDTLDTIRHLAELEIEAGNHDLADSMLVDLLRTYREHHSDQPVRRLFPLKALRESLHNRGLYAEASPYYEEFARLSQDEFGIEAPYTQSAFFAHARNSALAGDATGAMATLRAIVDASYSRHEKLEAEAAFELLHGTEFDALVERARMNATTDR